MPGGNHHISIHIYDVVWDGNLMQYSFDVNFTPISSEEIPGIMNKVLSNRSDNDGYISTAIEGILLPEYGEQLKNNVIDDYCSDSWNGGIHQLLGGNYRKFEKH